MIIIKFLVIFLTFNIYSKDISHCLKKEGTITICFCDKFCIDSIEANKDTFNLPYSVYKLKKYKNVFINDKELYNKIMNCVYKNFSSYLDKCNIGYKLIEFIPLKSEKRIANAIVNFDGINVVFGIIKKNDYFLILPPKEFFFIDEEYKKSVFKYIIDLWKVKK
ncbi:MAG: hypothetical protein N2Z20_04815 [Elusimicrobiales bacterium]|nr:hypothetical protein [Elusimicrobiales bacterium]